MELPKKISPVHPKEFAKIDSVVRDYALDLLTYREAFHKLHRFNKNALVSSILALVGVMKKLYEKKDISLKGD